MTNRQKGIDSFFLWCNSFFVASLSFPKSIFNISLILWILASITWMAVSKKFSFRIIFKNKISLGMIGLYLSTIIALTYSSSYADGLFLVERLSLLLVAPILMSSVFFFPDKNKLLRHVSWGFIIGSFVILLWAIVLATGRFFDTPVPITTLDFSKLAERANRHFTYHIFAKGAETHAIYLALYLVFGFFIVLDKLKNEPISPAIKRLLIVIGSLFFLFIFLLKSANISFTFVFLLSLYFIIRGGINNSNWMRFSIIFSLSFLTISGILLLKANQLHFNNNTYIFLGISSLIGALIPKLVLLINTHNWKIKPALFISFVSLSIISVLVIPQIKSLESWVKEHPSNVSARYWNWRSASDLILESPLLGLGSGESSDALVDKYIQYQFEGGMNHHYNEHNQYLRTWMDSGLIGLFFLLFIIFHMYKESLKHAIFPFIAITILLVLVSITESVFTRRVFISFITYFSLLYSYIILDEESAVFSLKANDLPSD